MVSVEGRGALDELVRSSAVFADLDAPTRATLTASFERRVVPRGTLIIREGDPADGLYLVERGRLRVEVTDDSGERVVLGEVGRGEVVGELALLAAGPRSADVVAMRDSVVHFLPVSAFDEFIAEHPTALRAISTVLVMKLVATAHGRQQTATGHTFVLVPTEGTPRVRAMTDAIAAAVARVVGDVWIADGDAARDAVGADADALAFDSWCETVGHMAGGSVLITDPTYTAWTDACAQQADCVVFVVDGAAPRAVQSVERGVLEGTGATRPRVELVIVYPESADTPNGTAVWLAARHIDRHHNVRAGSEHDAARVARLLTGRGIGVVFSGGGARGIAHIGVVRAMQSRGIPIDAVGGVSIGSIIGGAVARGDTPERIEEQVRAAVLSRSPVDLTFPAVSVAAGSRVTGHIRNGAADLDVEDGWLNFFCVSANLSRRTLEVHRSGPAWIAIRSSFSVPGIFPPMHNAAGDTLVDGGVIDNMPVSTMRAEHPGILVIAIDVGANKGFAGAGGTAHGATSGWRELRSAVRRRSVRSAFGLPKLLMRLTELGAGDPDDLGDCYVRPELAGVSLLDFDRFDDLVVGGERDAAPALDAWVATGVLDHRV